MTTANARAVTHLQILASLAIAVLIGACASVDFSYPKLASHAISPLETAETSLGQNATALASQHPEVSGFVLLLDGIDALAARLVAARKAERSIDAQYYLINNDTVGFAFIGALLQAADRGVRVRLLLDDIQTQGYDVGLAALDAHPNFEVRMFNPFAGRSSRIGDGLTDFSRVNRRMHNKSFTVDNQLTIIGGRNIADEYFGARKDVNFGDADVAGIGPVVQDVSTMFDLYWNHEAAVPVPGFADMPDDPAAALEDLRALIETRMAEARATQYGEALETDYLSYMTRDNGIHLTWAPWELVYDSPDKYARPLASTEQSIVSSLSAAIDRASDGIVVISPYFVPRSSGIDYFRQLRDRGLHVKVITNSLAANNHGVVHAGYAPSRKELLRMGVELYEVKATKAVRGSERGGSGASLATLHTKAFIVDDRELFIGSFNWDPRSVNINTELGVIIKSPELGHEVLSQMQSQLDERTYEVVLNEQDQLRWVDSEGAEPVIHDREPDTSWWRRTKAMLGRLLPIRGQL
ncbi:MAG TPA: phospholipase D family protein [Woeseiaceae bacterium]|nr:phospholipase D family protein [Woeseiaceae bacterium]